MTDIDAHTADVRVQAAQQSDLPSLAEIYWSAWHETHAPFIPAAVVQFRDRRFFERRVHGFGRQAIAARRGDVVMGFAVWGEAQLQQLWLRRDARGFGIGTALTETAESLLAAAGTKEAQLTCMAANETARRFYERRGWSVVSRFDKELEHATGAVPVPCWRMAKKLGGRAARLAP